MINQLIKSTRSVVICTGVADNELLYDEPVLIDCRFFKNDDY